MSNEKYSRQIITFGSKIMKKISNLNIMIVGCDTIGTECAKSLVLMGINKIYLYDKTIFSDKHKGRIIFQDNNNGKSLDIICSQFLQVLNSNIEIIVMDIQISENNEINLLNYIKENNINAIVNSCNKYNFLENVTRKSRIPYIFGDNSNLLGYVYVNFNKWIVDDVDGERLLSGFINNWNSKDGIIRLEINELKKCICSKTIKLVNTSNSDTIIIDKFTSDIVRDHQLNTCKLVININKFQYKKSFIDNLLKFLNCYNNISFLEIKDSIKINHLNKEELKFLKSYQLIKLSNSFSKDDKLYEEYMYNLQHINNTNVYKFYPLGTIIGSILSSEALKITGKYMPLNQELLFDYRGLQSSNTYLTESKDFLDIYNLLDKNLIKQIKKQSIFLVGCGALGCEISKNLSMMGFCTTKKGKLTITDRDTIELSNLSRQFMYQNEDINHLKSDILKKKLNKYFPKINVLSFNHAVGNDTEDVFNGKFWKEHNLVINALDNVEAREYVDNKCNIFETPLFESGTSGNKGNTQPIIPYETATYSEINDPEVDETPMCTIKNFPYLISHCVEWSLEKFDKLIEIPINNIKDIILDYNIFIQNINKIDNFQIKSEIYYNTINIMKLIIELVHDNHDKSLEIILMIFKNQYVYPIKSLLDMYSNNDKFWIGNRIKPELNLLKKENLINFIVYLLELISDLFNIKHTIYIDSIEQYVTKFNIDANHITKENNEADILNEPFLKTMSKLLQKNISTRYVNYVYDKDNIIHQKLSNNLSNLRADIYSIKNIDLVEFSILSGRITPALSTTTSLISGLVIIDILKYLSKTKYKYTESNVNLAINTYNIYDTNTPKIFFDNMFMEEYNMKINTIPKDFNTWSRININCKNDLIFTIQNLINFLNDQYTITPSLITYKNNVIYNTHIKEKYINLKIKEIYVKFKIGLSEILILDINASNGNIPIFTPRLLLKIV